LGDDQGDLFANNIKNPTGKDADKDSQMAPDRAGVCEEPLERHHRGDRRENSKKGEERDTT